MPPLIHSFGYRPLRGGIQVYNPLAGGVGTLGLVVTTDGDDRWIVSCCHVLCRKDLGAFTDSEPIYQPTDESENLVARVCAQKANAQLDCAAAKVENGICAVNEVLGLRPVTGISSPRVGMRVLKSGCATGVTEGMICQIRDDSVDIQPVQGFPSRYDLCQEGDSGAIWICAETGCAVAMHRAGNAYGGRTATAVRMQVILDLLKLRLITT